MIQYRVSYKFEIGIGEIAKVGFSGGVVGFRGGGLGFECAKMDASAEDGYIGGPGVRGCFVHAFIS